MQLLQPKEFVANREAMERVWDPEESAEYTRRLATGH